PAGKLLVGRGLKDAVSGKDAEPRAPATLGSPADVRFGRSTGLVLTHEDEGYRVWQIDKKWKPLTPILRSPASEANCRLGGPGPRTLIAAEDGATRLWDRAAAAPALPRLGYRQSIARYSPDGRRVVTGDNTGWAGVWDAATGRRVSTGSMFH